MIFEIFWYTVCEYCLTLKHNFNLLYICIKLPKQHVSYTVINGNTCHTQLSMATRVIHSYQWQHVLYTVINGNTCHTQLSFQI